MWILISFHSSALFQSIPQSHCVIRPTMLVSHTMTVHLYVYGHVFYKQIIFIGCDLHVNWKSAPTSFKFCPSSCLERPVLPHLKLFSRNIPANSCFDNWLKIEQSLIQSCFDKILKILAQKGRLVQTVRIPLVMPLIMWSFLKQVLFIFVVVTWRHALDHVIIFKASLIYICSCYLMLYTQGRWSTITRHCWLRANKIFGIIWTNFADLLK